MGIRTALAVAAALALAACDAPPVEGDVETCPAAGPCAEGEEPVDSGFCGDDGTWTPCLSAAADFCDIEREDGERVGREAVTCRECATRWLDIDFGRTTIRCPELPHSEVVVAD